MLVYIRKKIGFNVLFILAVAVFGILWNESFSYYWHRFSWPVLHSQSSDMRILFVADPQMIGYHDKYLSLQLLSSLAIWDSDRYLATGFRHAFRHVRPEVVVILGDIFDEGSTANDLEYVWTLSRFHRIFKLHENYTKIFLQGDNDVGGEGAEKRTDSKLTRFLTLVDKNTCQNNNSRFICVFRFVNFIKLNFMYTDSATDVSKNIHQLQDDLVALPAQLQILMNHQLVSSNSISRILTRDRKIFQINLIFSAHSHYSNVHSCKNCLRQNGTNSLHIEHLLFNKIYDFQPNPADLVEVTVPTCSYRMGVQNMAYGSAVISNEGKLQYAALLLPNRYKQLQHYGVGACISLCVILFRYFWLMSLPKKHFTYRHHSKR